MMPTPNQSFIPPEQPRNVFNDNKSGTTSQTGFAAAPFKGYVDSQENSRDLYGAPVNNQQSLAKRRPTRGEDFLNETINDRDNAGT